MADIEWDKKDLNSGKDSSGVANIQGVSGTENGAKQGYQHGSLTKGLVAYYPMERGKGEIIRDAVFNREGQIISGSWRSDSSIGEYALENDGESNFVLLGSSQESKLAGAEEATVAVWVKLNSIQRGRFYSLGNDNTADCFLRVDDDGQTRWWIIDDNDNRLLLDGGPVLDTDTWHHVVGVWRGGNDSEFYLNGEERTEDFSSVTGQNPDSVITGTEEECIGYRGRSNDQRVDGIISEVRLYRRALAKPEIEALYNLTEPNGVLLEESDAPDEQEGGVSCWGFDDGLDSDTAKDIWGGNDGSIDGAVYTSQRVYGSNAMSFDGENDYIEVLDDSSLDIEGAVTVACWVKPGIDDDTQRFVTKGTLDTEAAYNLFGSGGDVFSFRINGDNSYRVNSSTNISKGNWQFVVGIHTGEEQLIYVNGRLEGINKASTTINTNDKALGIGSPGGENLGEKWLINGEMDETKIYDRALSPLEVEKLFNKGSYRISRGDLLQ